MLCSVMVLYWSSFNNSCLRIGIVPIFLITIPAAKLANLNPLSREVFAIILAVSVAMTVSPAPDTSNTSLDVVEG